MILVAWKGGSLSGDEMGEQSSVAMVKRGVFGIRREIIYNRVRRDVGREQNRRNKGCA